MLQWFLTFPEFVEFNESSALFRKDSIKAFVVSDNIQVTILVLSRQRPPSVFNYQFKGFLGFDLSFQHLVTKTEYMLYLDIFVITIYVETLLTEQTVHCTWKTTGLCHKMCFVS